MVDELKLHDPKLEFIAMFIFKTFKIKADKWVKMYIAEENRVIIEDFMTKPVPNMIVFRVHETNGALLIYSLFPQQIKAKCVYFVKKTLEPIGKNGDMINDILYGDLSYSPVEQLYSIIDGVKNSFLTFKSGCRLELGRSKN
jgi:hypothetical protein